MADLKAFAEQLVNLSVKEVNELAKILKDEYGIEPAAAAVAIAAPGAGGGVCGCALRAGDISLGTSQVALIPASMRVKARFEVAIQLPRSSRSLWQ